MIGGKPTGGTSTRRKDQDGHGLMTSEMFFNVSHTRRSNCRVCDGMCTYTHLLHAHFSAHSARTITFSHFHACAHPRTAQVSVKRFVACVSYLSISPSLSHVSPILAVPALSLRHHVPDHILAELSFLKSARHAQLRTRSFVPRCSPRVAATWFSWCHTTLCFSTYHFSLLWPFLEPQFFS